MRPGREIDARIAKELFGHEVWAKNKVLHEKTPEGERPLRNYSKEIQYAWAVADKMRISLIATQGGQWFAFVAGHDGWESPKAFLNYLDGGDFSNCGAAVNENAAEAICEAALKSLDKRQFAAEGAKPHPNLEVVPGGASELTHEPTSTITEKPIQH